MCMDCYNFLLVIARYLVVDIMGINGMIKGEKGAREEEDRVCRNVFGEGIVG